MTMPKKTPKPKKPKHPLFVGVYVDKATLTVLDRIAYEEAASRSFIVRKLLTETLKKYELSRTVN